MLRGLYSLRNALETAKWDGKLGYLCVHQAYPTDVEHYLTVHTALHVLP
jgi:hypothetical protein